MKARRQGKPKPKATEKARKKTVKPKQARKKAVRYRVQAEWIGVSCKDAGRRMEGLYIEEETGGRVHPVKNFLAVKKRGRMP